MTDFLTTFFCIVLTVIFIAFVSHGIRNTSILREITNTGEIRVYDEVYTCKYKGKWKSKDVFIPKDVIVEEFKNR